jgi:hypothetical protein
MGCSTHRCHLHRAFRRRRVVRGSRLVVQARTQWASVDIEGREGGTDSQDHRQDRLQPLCPADGRG